jgi:hypothetical protein
MPRCPRGRGLHSRSLQHDAQKRFAPPSALAGGFAFCAVPQLGQAWLIDQEVPLDHHNHVILKTYLPNSIKNRRLASSGLPMRPNDRCGWWRDSGARQCDDSTYRPQTAISLAWLVPSSGLTDLSPPASPPLGADKAYDVHKFVDDLRDLNVTPHIAQNTGPNRSLQNTNRSPSAGRHPAARPALPPDAAPDATDVRTRLRQNTTGLWDRRPSNFGY